MLLFCDTMAACVGIVSNLHNVFKTMSLHALDICPTRQQSNLFRGQVQCKLVDNEQQVFDQGAQALDKFIRKNDETLRIAPIVFGGSSFLAVLLNRTLSGIAPVADASSAQSRADVLALALATTVVLTGLVWISVKPKVLTSVHLSGVECLRLNKALPSNAAAEIMWAWEALKEATRCQALVIVYRGHCVLQAGLAAESEEYDAVFMDCSKFVKGSLCRDIWASGKQSYLANLSLYPGRFELSFFPPNTQAVILQPLGDEEGVMVIGCDTVRGFGPKDQAWILSIGEKLDTTLGSCNI